MSMANVNIFEIAARNKLRFNFKGVLSVEDLWDLDLNSLDSIYKTLMKKTRENNYDSLLKTQTNENKNDQISIEIVKHIVSVKLCESQERELAAVNKAKKEELLKILQSKEQQELLNKSPEEIRKMIEELG